MPWGAAIAAAGAIGGSLIAGNAAENAADAQSDAADAATQLQADIFNQQREDQVPWQLAGRSGLNALLALSGLPQVTPAGIRGYLGEAETITDAQKAEFRRQALQGKTFGPEDQARYDKLLRDAQDRISGRAYQLPQFGQNAMPGQATAQGGGVLQQLMNDPGYQFRQQQQRQQLDRSASSRGGLFSGRAAKDLMRYGGDLASQEYGNTWNRLAAISGIGQTANSATGAAGQNYANQAGQNMIGAGNARASGYVGQANALTGAIGQGLNYYQNQQLLSGLNRGGYGSGFNYDPSIGQPLNTNFGGGATF